MAHTLPRTALAAATALSVALTSAAPALAWGDREQGIVTGIAGTLLIQGIARDMDGNGHRRPPADPQPYPDPYPPRPGYGYPPPPPPPDYYQQQRSSIYRTALARAFNSYSLRDRRDIQRELRRWGYGGAADGAFGPGTYAAVAAYARRTGQEDANRSMAAAYGVYDSLLY